MTMPNAPAPEMSDRDPWDADIEERIRFGICWKKPMGIADFGDVDITLTERRMQQAADEICRLRRELEGLRAPGRVSVPAELPDCVIEAVEDAMALRRQHGCRIYATDVWDEIKAALAASAATEG